MQLALQTSWQGVGDGKTVLHTDALAVFMNEGRVAGSATCSRVFTTSSGLVRKLLVRPAQIADPTWTVITCGHSTLLSFR